MSFTLRPQEAAFEASFTGLPPELFVPELRRVLATARPLPYYAGSSALARLTYKVAGELYDRGVVVDAAPIFREALDELTATLGAGHQVTARAAAELGSCLHVLGQNEEALPLLECALARLTQLLGDGNALVLYTLGTVAGVRRQLGNRGGAKALLQQGLTTLTRLAVAAGMAPDAPPPGLLKEWCHIKLNLSQLLMTLSCFEDCELLVRGTLAILAGLPACDPNLNLSINLLTFQLACSLHGLGLRGRGQDLLDAEKMYRELLPKLHGSSNYGSVAHGLGLLLKQRGLVTESRMYLNIAQEALSAGYGTDSSRTQLSQLHRSDLNASLRTCARCGPVTDDDITMKICQGCQAARYCSPACAELHWKAHKKECRRIKAESEQVAGGSGGAGPSTAGSGGAGSSGE